MANLFSIIKSVVIEAYTVACLSINPVVTVVEEAVVSEVSVATDKVADVVTAAEAVKGALAIADEAAKCCDTWEGYQEYCAAVQHLFAAEDAMLEAAGLVIPVVDTGATAVTVEEVEDDEEYDAEAHEAEYYAIAINHPELAAIAKALELEADEAANHCDTPKGYQEYCAAVQRFFAARDAVLEAEALSSTAILSSESSALLSEWDNSVWLASEVGQEVEKMVEEIVHRELFYDEYFGEMRAARKERKLLEAIAKAEAKEAARPTSFSWDEWNELTLAQKVITPLPAIVCTTVGSTVYTTALIAGGAAIYGLGVMPMSAGMALVALLGTMLLAPTGVIVAAMRISELNGIEVFEFTSNSALDD